MIHLALKRSRERKQANRETETERERVAKHNQNELKKFILASPSIKLIASHLLPISYAV